MAQVSGSDYNTALRETFMELFSLDKEYCPLTTGVMESFFRMRMAHLKKPHSAVEALKRAAIQTGSSVEGAATCRWLAKDKISIEVDVMYNLSDIPSSRTAQCLEDIPGRPGYYRFLYVDGLESDLEPAFIDILRSRGFQLKCSDSNYIDASALKELMVKVVRFEGKEEKMKKIDLLGLNAGTLSAVTEIEGPSACVTLTLEGIGGISLELSIDNVLCFHIPTWPARKWDSKTTHWPDEKMIQHMMKAGCHIVAKPANPPGVSRVSDSAEQSKTQYEWRVSFSLAEKYLASTRTPHQNECYFMFKSLFYAYLKPLQDHGQSLPSYIVKTIMMWALEELEPSQWQAKHLAENLKYLLKKLEECLRKGHLQHYFITEIDLLETVPAALRNAVADKVHNIIQEPLNYLPRNAKSLASNSKYLPSLLQGLIGYLEFRTMMYNFNL